jgi:exopolysaccharide biosynthesis protein
MRAREALIAGVLTLSSTVEARAASSKTNPAPGITHIHRWSVNVGGARQDYHVLLVDLGDRRLRFAVTKQADRKRTTSWLGAKYGALVAVNGSMFDFADRQPCGPIQSDRVHWTNAADICRSSVAFGAEGKIAFFDNLGRSTGPWPSEIASFARDGLSGRPWLVRDGQSQEPFTEPGSIGRRDARTAIGVTASGGTAIVVVVDAGRPGKAEGMTGSDLVSVFREFSARHALYLDGTGSSALYLRDEGGLVSTPSEGAEREVSNALVILPVAIPTPDAGPPEVGPPDAQRDDVATSPAESEVGRGGPEDPTGESGEPADPNVYETPSAALPKTGSGPDASGCTCRHRGGSTRSGLALFSIAGAVFALFRRRGRPR